MKLWKFCLVILHIKIIQIYFIPKIFIKPEVIPAVVCTGKWAKDFACTYTTRGATTDLATATVLER